MAPKQKIHGPVRIAINTTIARAKEAGWPGVAKPIGDAVGLVRTAGWTDLEDEYWHKQLEKDNLTDLSPQEEDALKDVDTRVQYFKDNIQPSTTTPQGYTTKPVKKYWYMRLKQLGMVDVDHVKKKQERKRKRDIDESTILEDEPDTKRTTTRTQETPDEGDNDVDETESRCLFYA